MMTSSWLKVNFIILNERPLSPPMSIIAVNSSYRKESKTSLYLTSLMYSYSKLGIPQPGTYTSSQLGDPEATLWPQNKGLHI